MILLILAVVAASLTAYALFVNNDNDSIEEYDYVIENKQGPIEIRRYNACYFNTVNLPKKIIVTMLAMDLEYLQVIFLVVMMNREKLP